MKVTLNTKLYRHHIKNNKTYYYYISIMVLLILISNYFKLFPLQLMGTIILIIYLRFILFIIEKKHKKTSKS